MTVDFYKLHVCGNDAVLLNFLYAPIPDEARLSALARALCPRRTGVGANGVVVVHQSEGSGIGLVHLTPRGDVAGVDNDALFCLARFAFDSGLVESNRIEVETGRGPRSIEAIDSESFRLSLGPPRSLDGLRDLTEEPDTEANTFIEIDGKRQVVTPVFVHRPFLVVVSAMKGSSVRELTRAVRRSVPGIEALPVFLRALNREEISVHSWQSAQVQDSASTVAAAAAASILNGFCDNDLVVDFKGHTLFVQWVQRTNQLLVTATPRYVYSGSFYMEE